MPPKAPPAHPTYEVMVKAAIVSLKERSGSSTQAIAKYLAATYTLPDGWKKVLATQVKNLLKSEKLLKVKNSFKLGEALKKAPKKVVKKKAKVVKKKVVKKKAKASPRTPALPPKTLDRSIPIYAKHKKYILI
jgi:histone H1/5